MDRLTELYNKIYEQEKLITYLINQRNEWINKYDGLLKRKSNRGVRDTEIMYCKYCNIAIMAGAVSYQAEGNHLTSKSHIKNAKHYEDPRDKEFLEAREAEYNRAKKNIASAHIDHANDFEVMIEEFDESRYNDVVSNIEFEKELNELF